MMSDFVKLVLGLLIPFIGTSLGAALVFFMKDQINPVLQKILLGFAAGVMVAASIWSLIIPSLDQSVSLGKWSFIPAAVGFILGILFLMLLDTIIPHLHLNEENPEGIKSKLSRTSMMVLAVTLHNIPEGMACGVVLAAAYNSTDITITASFALAIGIAIQNFPEGAIVSMPLKAEGNSKLKSFGLGALSGIVEPIAALITILLTSLVTAILPYLLSFAAGVMLYVVVEELIPEAQEEPHTNFSTLFFGVGFVLMMILDIVFG